MNKNGYKYLMNVQKNIGKLSKRLIIRVTYWNIHFVFTLQIKTIMKTSVTVWKSFPPAPQTVTKIFDANDSEIFDAVSCSVSFFFLHFMLWQRFYMLHTAVCLYSLHKHFTVTQNGWTRYSQYEHQVTLYCICWWNSWVSAYAVVFLT